MGEFPVKSTDITHDYLKILYNFTLFLDVSSIYCCIFYSKEPFQIKNKFIKITINTRGEIFSKKLWCTILLQKVKKQNLKPSVISYHKGN